MVKNLDHVNIVVSNLNAAKEFFFALGFRVIKQGELEGDWISSIVQLESVKAVYAQLSLKNSRTNIELIQYYWPISSVSRHKELANQIGIRHLAFEVDDIEKEVEGLKEKGFMFFSNIEVYPETGKKLVYFYGPDEIIIEMAQYE